MAFVPTFEVRQSLASTGAVMTGDRVVVRSGQHYGAVATVRRITATRFHVTLADGRVTSCTSIGPYVDEPAMAHRPIREDAFGRPIFQIGDEK